MKQKNCCATEKYHGESERAAVRISAWVPILLSLFLSTAIVAKESEQKESTDQSKWSVSLSYFGEWISHPGFTLGAEYKLRENQKQSVKLFTALSAGRYVHQENHKALFIDALIGHRFTTPVGYFGDILLGVGYLHTWPDAVGYTGVDEDGNLIEKDHPGDPHIKLNLSLGLLGWDFGKRTNIPLTAVTRVALFGETHYNDYILPHVALQVEFTYQFCTRKGDKHA